MKKWNIAPMSPSRARTSLLEKAISSKKATVNRVDIIVRVISPVRAATSVKEVTSPVRVVTSNVKAATSPVINNVISSPKVWRIQLPTPRATP